MDYILGMALVTYLLRAAFLLLPPGMRPLACCGARCDMFRRGVTAIWARKCWWTMNDCCGVVAIAGMAVATTFATIIAGLLALHLFSLLR